MFAWSARDRLTPLRMVWLERNYNSPKYELEKYRKPDTRRHTRCLSAVVRVDYDRDTRRDFPRSDDGMMWRRKPKT